MINEYPAPAPLTQTNARGSLMPAANLEQASDNGRGQGYQPNKKQQQNNTVPASANETERPYAPITPGGGAASGGGIIRKHIPLQENAVPGDIANPLPVLRRRARAYENMMLR